MTDEMSNPMGEDTTGAGNEQAVGEGPGGMPGGGVGRREDPGQTGVWPASAADAPDAAAVRSEGAWGRGAGGGENQTEAGSSEPVSGADALVPAASDEIAPDGA